MEVKRQTDEDQEHNARKDRDTDQVAPDVGVIRKQPGRFTLASSRR